MLRKHLHYVTVLKAGRTCDYKNELLQGDELR